MLKNTLKFSLIFLKGGVKTSPSLPITEYIPHTSRFFCEANNLDMDYQYMFRQVQLLDIDPSVIKISQGRIDLLCCSQLEHINNYRNTTANTLTKNANPECYLIVPDANIELISLHQFASHFNSKWQIRLMRAIVHLVIVNNFFQKWPKIANEGHFLSPNGPNDPRNTTSKYTEKEWPQIEEE